MMDYKEHCIQNTKKSAFLQTKQQRMMEIRDDKFYHAKEKFKAPPYGVKGAGNGETK